MGWTKKLNGPHQAPRALVCPCPVQGHRTNLIVFIALGPFFTQYYIPSTGRQSPDPSPDLLSRRDGSRYSSAIRYQNGRLGRLLLHSFVLLSKNPIPLSVQLRLLTGWRCSVHVFWTPVGWDHSCSSLDLFTIMITGLSHQQREGLPVQMLHRWKFTHWHTISHCSS